MNILGWILFGFVVGLIARAVIPGRDPIGLIGTTILGVIGALAGGWLGQALGWYGPEDGAGFFAATIGAVVVLLIYNFVTARMSGTRSHGNVESLSDRVSDKVKDIKDKAA